MLVATYFQALACVVVSITPASSARVVQDNIFVKRQGLSSYPEWLRKVLWDANAADLQETDPSAIVRRQQDDALCYEDGVLSYFQQNAQVTPFCSSFLSIAAQKTTETVTSTSTTFVGTTIFRSHAAMTTTSTVTEYITPSEGAMRKAKRAPAVTPAAKLIARQGADGFTSSENQDQLLASTVSSACSCIDITTATTTLTATTSVLSTESYLQYEDTTSTDTILVTVTSTIMPKSSSSSTGTTPTPTMEGDLCPAPAGGFYVTDYGNTYDDYCGEDFPYFDLVNGSAVSDTDCIYACEAYNMEDPYMDCDGAVYEPISGTCFLKQYTRSINGIVLLPSAVVEPDVANAFIRRYTPVSLNNSQSGNLSTPAEATVFSTVYSTAYSTIYANASATSATPTASATPSAVAPVVDCSNGTANGTTTSMYYDGMLFNFLVLCNENIPQMTDVFLARDNSSACEASCAMADASSTITCYGFTYIENSDSGDTNCFLHTNNTYVGTVMTGYTSYWLLSRSYSVGNSSSSSNTTSQPLGPSVALAAAVANSAPAVVTPASSAAVARRQATMGNSTITAPEAGSEWTSGYGSSFSTQYSATTTTSSSSTTTIIIIVNNSSYSSSSGGSSGGGYYGNGGGFNVSTCTTSSIAPANTDNRTGSYSSSMPTTVLYPNTTAMNGVSTPLSGDMTSTVTLNITATVFPTNATTTSVMNTTMPSSVTPSGEDRSPYPYPTSRHTPNATYTDSPIMMNSTMMINSTSAPFSIPMNTTSTAFMPTATMNSTMDPIFASNTSSMPYTMSMNITSTSMLNSTCPTIAPSTIYLYATTVTEYLELPASSSASAMVSSSPTSSILPAACETAGNQITNGGFESVDSQSNAIGWTVSTLNSAASTFADELATEAFPQHTGGGSRLGEFVISQVNLSTVLSQPVALCPNSQYQLSAWFRPADDAGICQVVVSIEEQSWTIVPERDFTTRAFQGFAWSWVTGNSTSSIASDVAFNVTCYSSPDESAQYKLDIDDVALYRG